MQAEITHLADQLQAAPPEQRPQMKEHFIAHLRGELDSLVTLLSTKEFEAADRIDPVSPAYHAVEILQFARYSEAVGLFVQHIDTRATDFPSVSDEKQAHFPFFPFAVALTALGVPALPALATGGLGAALNTTRFQLCCLVVKEILGEELALQYVGNLAKDHPPMRESQRIEEASRLIRMRTNTWNALYCADYSPLNALDSK